MKINSSAPFLKYKLDPLQGNRIYLNHQMHPLQSTVIELPVPKALL